MKLSVFSEQRLEILSKYGKSEKDMKEYIGILRLWMSKMPHLPGDALEDDFLEVCVLKNKFSLEKCKAKIEMYCTLKAKPNFNTVYDKIPVPSKEPVFHLPLPILTDEGKRIVVYRIDDTERYDMLTDLTYNASFREFLLRYDYNDGEIVIGDLQKCTSSILTKFRVNIFIDSLQLIMQGYSARISEVHVVSKMARTLLSSILPLVPTKYRSRVQFHDDSESLRKKVPAKYLPSDYGGEYKSLTDIRADWDQIFQENRQLLKTFAATKAREELRQNQGSANENMNGTFRKLNID